MRVAVQRNLRKSTTNVSTIMDTLTMRSEVCMTVCSCICTKQVLQELFACSNIDCSLLCGQSMTKSQCIMCGSQMKRISTSWLTEKTKCAILGPQKYTYAHQENASFNEGYSRYCSLYQWINWTGFLQTNCE